MAICDECGCDFVVSGDPGKNDPALSGSAPRALDGFVQCDACRALPRPRTSGNADEYRSPMLGGAGRSVTGGAQRGGPRRPMQHAAPRGAAAIEGEYRAPGFGGRLGIPGASAPEPRPGPRRGRGHADQPAGSAYAITCSSCGAAATVPFQPTPGREVFCKDCFRTRRSAR